MPKGRIASITVDSGGSGYSATPVVTIEDVYFTGSGATATATVTGGVITGITVTSPGTGYSAPVVIISDATGDRRCCNRNPWRTIYGRYQEICRFPARTERSQGQTTSGSTFRLLFRIPQPIPALIIMRSNLAKYSEKLHSDLPNTTLRGYRQTNTARSDGQQVPQPWPTLCHYC